MTSLSLLRPMSPCKKVTLAGVVCFAGLFAAAMPADAFQLITLEEAALPAGPVPDFQLRAAVQRDGRMWSSYHRDPLRACCIHPWT
jgi:hypothetical protein